MLETQTFKIVVRDEHYNVESVDIGSEIEYKISTACNYIMTIRKNEDDEWHSLKDVVVLDENLVEEIGAAIELIEN